MGRFGAQDTVRDGLNYYLYCDANPLKYVDKNGLWAEDGHNFITAQAGTNLNLTTRVTDLLMFHNYDTDTLFRAIGNTSWVPLLGNQSYHMNRNRRGQGDSRQELYQLHRDAAINLVNGSNLCTDLIPATRMLDALNQANIDVSHISNRLRDDDRITLPIVGWTIPGTGGIRNALTRRERTIAEAINDPVIGNEVRQAIALQNLGRGLHALQDVYAHGQIDAGSLNFMGHGPHTAVWYGSRWVLSREWGVNPDHYRYVWRKGSNTRLTRVDSDDASFGNNPRIIGAIVASEAFLQQFIDSIYDSSWLTGKCID